MDDDNVLGVSTVDTSISSSSFCGTSAPLLDLETDERLGTCHRFGIQGKVECQCTLDRRLVFSEGVSVQVKNGG